MRRRIQVGNLGDSVDDHALAALFAPHGKVRYANVATHFDTGHTTGVGFVEMERHQDGDAAITALSGSTHCGKVISVCWSGPQKKLKATETAGFADRRSSYGVH